MNCTLLYDEIPVEYSDQGAGRPLVLLHGYLEAKEIWQPLTTMLENTFRVISVDLPGHGSSGINGETHSMEYLADAVREVIKKTGEKKILLAGHSLGGYVTLAFAERYPEMLAGYILFHSHPNPDSPEAIEKRNREIRVVLAGKKDIMYPANISMMFAPQNLPQMNMPMQRSKEIASHIPAEGIIAMLNGMKTRPSRVSVVESGEVPLLWILGRHDQYFSPEKALGKIKLPANARAVILEQSGHLGFVEESEKSAVLINEFAGKLKW